MMVKQRRAGTHLLPVCAKAGKLGIEVREETALQQGVVREANARDCNIGQRAASADSKLFHHTPM